MPEKLTHIQSLLIEEISGVDSPANDLPGWIVAKAKSGTMEQELSSLLACERNGILTAVGKSKLAAYRKAAETTAEQSALADAIRANYGLTEKGRHETRDGSGKFTPAQEDPPAPETETPGPILPWRHSGAAIPGVSG